MLLDRSQLSYNLLETLVVYAPTAIFSAKICFLFSFVAGRGRVGACVNDTYERYKWFLSQTPSFCSEFFSIQLCRFIFM